MLQLPRTGLLETKIGVSGGSTTAGLVADEIASNFNLRSRGAARTQLNVIFTPFHRAPATKQHD
jgi:hypothetical protein